jgi:hypothetical protein
VWPHAHSARPGFANTRAQHCFLASASGPKLWPDVYAVIKLNINMAVAYGWIPHNAGFGVLDLTPSILLLRQFWD